ncbi:hypothetical protein [Halopiger djelfimassiliensis]|uniref:hypothetical protein n=1 Tax=Halopiger djelfimassiliensis TaxID=1293047 RepID=UPI0006782D74|nr:hypothetical protein [Halopiger djelfimassiliensis]
MLSDKTKRHAAAALVILLIGTLTLGVVTTPAAAQTTTPENSTVTNDTDTDRSLIYQFDDSDAELRSVTYDNGTAFVTLGIPEGGSPETLSVADAGLEESGSFSYQTIRVIPGEEVTVEIPVRSPEITVTTSSDGYYHQGDIGVSVVDQPTDQLIQIGALSGVIGSIIALGIVIGQLRRRHSNTYEELYSDRRVKIEEDPVEGIYEWLLRALKNTAESKLRIALVGALVLVLVGMAAGTVPTPGEIWDGLSDSQRLLVAGSLGASIVALGPVYLLVKRIWNPDREFVLDLDSKDVYRAADGDKSGSIATYSAPPERIDDLDVDGAMTTLSTPGGRCHLVRGFDAEANEAEGNPPYLHDDREVSIEADRIEANRQKLTDLAQIGRDLIASMSTFRVVADANAVRDIDASIRDSLSAGGDSLEQVLVDAVEGTRYEGTYQPDKPESDAEEPDPSDSNPTPDADNTGSSGADVTADADGGGSTEESAV